MGIGKKTPIKKFKWKKIQSNLKHRDHLSSIISFASRTKWIKRFLRFSFQLLISNKRNFTASFESVKIHASPTMKMEAIAPSYSCPYNHTNNI